ncbi:MAG: F0F1 ATP synthase subunit delta [Chloroflexota bacterium]|nr:F0F1 ATP synthase subunit delta [Chloroflexota bacterium]
MELIPNLTTVILEVVNFLVLTYLLYRFLFKPTLKNIRARTEEQARLLTQAHADQEEAVALRATWQSKLAGTEEQAAALITAAQKEAEGEHTAIVHAAEEEAERILVEAYADAAQIHRQATEKFQAELLTAVLEISGAVVYRLAPEGLHDTMVKQLSQRIWEMGRDEMERVETFRNSLGDRVPTAHVTSARPLTPELQGTLARTFSALADRNVDLDIKTDPALAGGVRVRLGDLVVDNSVAGQLSELRESVAASLAEQLSDE